MTELKSVAEMKVVDYAKFEDLQLVTDGDGELVEVE